MDKIDKTVKKMKKATTKVTKSKAKSRKFLVDAGIYTKDGKLTTPYRIPVPEKLENNVTKSTILKWYCECDCALGLKHCKWNNLKDCGDLKELSDLIDGLISDAVKTIENSSNTIVGDCSCDFTMRKWAEKARK